MNFARGGDAGDAGSDIGGLLTHRMKMLLNVVLVVIIIAAAAVIYLHMFVWPTMTASVAKSNTAALNTFGELMRVAEITWWYRDRSLASVVRQTPMTTMEVGAFRDSMPDMASALRGCDIISPTHLRWTDVDVFFYDIEKEFVTLDGNKVYPAETMLPIDANMPKDAATMVNVLLPGEPRVHETLRAMYRVMNMAKKEDGEVSAS
jgi:hypothetical protein